MTEQNRITEAILAQLSKEILKRDQIGNILNYPIEFPMKLIEEISLLTALKYWNEQITYTEGDYIMNNLFAYSVTRDSIDISCWFLSIAWECYLAFDSGEFYRDNDDRSIDPSEKYTRPLVKSLLKKQKLI